MRLNLQLFKGGVKSGSGAETVDQREAHFASENARVEQLMATNNGELIMANGEILGRDPLDKLWGDFVLEAKKHGTPWEDDTITLHYGDGHYEVYMPGDSFGKGDALRKGLVGIAFEDGYSLRIAGKGFKFVNYRERYGEEWSYGEDDWRIEESTDHPVYRQSKKG